MLLQIETMKDVKAFIEQIATETDNFHPLADFYDYVHPNSYFRRYTDEEAEMRNQCLEHCFKVCATVTTDFFTYLLKLFENERAGALIEQ